MSYRPPTVEYLNHLLKRRTDIKACATSLLVERRAQGVEELGTADSIRFRSMLADAEALTSEIEDYRADLERSQIPEKYQNLGRGGGARSMNSAGRVCPIHFETEELRGLHQKVLRGEPGRIESRGFTGVSPLLPSSLFPTPIFPQHDNRVMDRWPGQATDAPSVEYIRVDTVTGTASVVNEGGLKPELLMPATSQIVSMQKLAAHVGVSWEATQDFDAFVSAVQAELVSRIIDTENYELLLGDGTAGHLTGILSTPGILTHDATAVAPDTAIDHIEQAISELRVGNSLAEADLAIFHPATWSAIRRTKDGQDRYLTQADPTVGEANSIWGVPVLVTTQLTEGLGVLVDSTKFGRVHVREPIGVRVGFSGDDFTRNIVRYVSEERIALAVERPSAVVKISGLPTATVAATKAKR